MQEVARLNERANRYRDMAKQICDDRTQVALLDQAEVLEQRARDRKASIELDTMPVASDEQAEAGKAQSAA